MGLIPDDWKKDNQALRHKEHWFHHICCLISKYGYCEREKKTLKTELRPEEI